jgi:CheY-like chemotaxis protein/signal transduction histidine kinase/HAMP domain-containing protein
MDRRKQSGPDGAAPLDSARNAPTHKGTATRRRRRAGAEVADTDREGADLAERAVSQRPAREPSRRGGRTRGSQVHRQALRNVLDGLRELEMGNFAVRLTNGGDDDLMNEVVHAFNHVAALNQSFAEEVVRVGTAIGREGRLTERISLGTGARGDWRVVSDSVNTLIGDLVQPTAEIARVIQAVAQGDLSQKVALELDGRRVRGEYHRIASIVNTMVDQLRSFANEVTRVAREVGTEGKLGGQAHVPGVAGTWKDLTDSVNNMASNLTTQVRNIALVTTAVANGDLSQKIGVEAKGEVLELKNTINAMVDRLRIFGDEVTRVAREVGLEGKLGGQANVPDVAGTWKALTDNVNQLADNLTTQVRAIADVATAVTRGDLTQQVDVEAQGEVAELKDNINRMILTLKETTQKNAEQDWLKSNLAKFSRMMQGQKDLQSVSRLIMSELTPLVGGSHGAFFIAESQDGQPVLRLIASYAYKARRHVSTRFRFGEGLVGQAALERSPILLTNVPDDYIQINSGLGEAPPRTILVMPIMFEGEVKAVIELASFQGFSEIHQLFLDQLVDSIGVVLNMIQASMRTEELLEQSQSLAHELQQQQEELRRSNVELEQQARTLRESEELLRDQQEELQQVNEELEEKAALLAEQNKKVEQKNREVEAARLALEEKAEQLAISSKYKSEFLANMSHELRTPLNSLLILARLLAENRDGNLTEKQVEFARTIYSAGTDLLTLINDVLDLSKVEAGRLELHPAPIEIAELRSFVERTFSPVAEQKGLEFTVEVQPDVPETITTDGQRLQQILKNLLSNAFKFTEEGSVGLTIRVAERTRHFANPALDKAPMVLAFAVHDTGIGIPKEKQQLIFEAFQQADGTTNRRYGGTGLGLSISREIAGLLQGEIRVESTPSHGSTFTLLIPSELQQTAPKTEPAPATIQPQPFRSGTVIEPEVDRRKSKRHTIPAPVPDDRDDIEEGDRTVLIVENDIHFASVMLEMAREKQFKGIVVTDGESALAMARDYVPDAITLDLDLPGEMDGWTVLDRLKRSADTRHIPVHIVSAYGTRQRGLRAGALAFLEKPVDKEVLEEAFANISQFIDQRVRHLLVVEDDEAQRKAIVELVGDDDIEITAVGTAAEAMETLRTRRVDCMVLDLGIGDRNGFQLLEEVKSDPERRDLPIIIYTGRSLSSADEMALRRYAETIIVKDVKSPERLLDETALFLHRIESHLPEQKRRMLEQLHTEDEVFHGKRILIVDDDVRNVFSLTSLLEEHGMEVEYAENGRDALARLGEGNFDLVLMDVMMPEMDGYEATQRIRDNPDHRSLPIICLTAKAMKGDREKCIAAGASDYIVKPVDPEQLLSLMRVWLYR